MINHYQILDLPDFATAEEVKQAYRSKCKQYHPDLVATLGPKLQMLARREMAKVNHANQTLGDPESKAKFDGWLRSARSSEGMRTCMICGIRFEPEEGDNSGDVCTSCLESSAAQNSPAPPKNDPLDPEALLRTCFVTLHHFTSSAVLKKFAPSINILVGESRMKVYGPPGPMKIVLDSKELYNLVEPNPRIVKHPWSAANRIGTISFKEAHPIEAAAALWDFCRQTVGDPELKYCRIAINNPDYTAYEATLGESIIMALAGISPWTAAKLYTRHGRNLAEAMRDSEAAVSDPYFSVLVRPSLAEKQNEIDRLRHRNNRIETEFLDATRELEARKLEIEERKAAVAELLQHLSELEPLKIEASKLRRELGERNSTIVELLTNIEDIWQSIFMFFHTYKEFAADVSLEELQVQDLGLIFENMHREIQALRARERKTREESEAAAARPADVLPMFRENSSSLESDTKELWKSYIRGKGGKDPS